MKILLLIILLCGCLESKAQKVAVVLSGGGSKGAAHIGVLKALEENHIPIDYIAGTSIGAIIGGLYANGWSPDEMEALITSEEFRQWAYGQIDDQYIFYYKIPDPNPAWATFRFNFDSVWTFRAPTSIISPCQMDYKFMEIFSQSTAMSGGNFDSLFIPFRCIGANISDMEETVFRNGDLGQCVRASMTYPLYFKPIEINGKLYMDGGMFNNFPTQVAIHDFHPDVIIGVKVAGENSTPTTDNVMSQLENIFMEKTDYSIPIDSSILIEPDIPTANVIDFSRASAFIDIGYNATLAKMDEIRLIIRDSISPDSIAKRRQLYNSGKPPMKFNGISVNGVNQYQSEYISKSFKHRKKFLDGDEMRRGYFRLVADEFIQTIYPSCIFQEADSSFHLNLEVKKETNLQARFGGLISSNPVNEAFAEVEYKHLGRQALSLLGNLYMGKFYSSGSIKLRLDFPGQRPFYTYGSIIYNQWDYFKTSTRFFEDKTPSYLVENDYHWDLGLGIPARNRGKFELSICALLNADEYFQTNEFSRTDLPDKTNFKALHYKLFWERSTLNRKAFANTGTFIRIGLSAFDGTEVTIPGTTSIIDENSTKHHQWFSAKFEYENYFKTLKKMRIGWFNDVYWSNQQFFSNYTASLLYTKAFQPVIDSRTLFMPQFRAHSYASAGLRFVWMMSRNLDVRLEGYVFQPYQKIISGESNVYATYGPILDDRYFIGSAIIVFHNPLGPISLSLSYFDHSEDPLMLSFHFGYLLFNQRALD